MKIAGLSLWIWKIWGIVILATAGVSMVAVPMIRAASKPVPLEVVTDELWQTEQKAEVRGRIFNPRKTPARHVKISYELTKLNVETNAKTKLDSAKAGEIRYVPPGGTVDYTAYSGIFQKTEVDVVVKGQALISESGDQ